MFFFLFIFGGWGEQQHWNTKLDPSIIKSSQLTLKFEPPRIHVMCHVFCDVLRFYVYYILILNAFLATCKYQTQVVQMVTILKCYV
jgi:hypothetical protein